MRNVKIAAIQMQCSTNLQDNLEKAEKMVRQAAGDGAQIILLPELFEREYFCQQRRYDFYHLAKPVEKNDAVQMGMRLAKELNVVLPISFYEQDVNTLYNSIACIDDRTPGSTDFFNNSPGRIMCHRFRKIFPVFSISLYILRNL